MYVIAFLFLKLTVPFSTFLDSFKSTDVNETHNMLNWVNEEGYTRAAVRCEAYSVDDYHGAWFGGYWYPDI